MDYKEQLSEIMEQIKQERDELNVQLHLAKAEIRDDWDELEKQWDSFKLRSEKVAAAADSSADDIGEALKILGDELKAGYEKIRKSIG
mgnify:CR=1 FL=1